MRIGSLANIAFQKYEKCEPRDTVVKHIPGYVQTFSYDLVSTNPTIQVDGTLVGTSAANLAAQISTLKAMYRNKKVVWIDASDQYQGLLDFCRITKLQGPTLDAKTGPLIATFSLEAISLLPWGTTQFNPYSAPGVVLRDLSGVGHETVLNPLSMNSNFILSSALQSNQGGNGSNWFSWEFIVDNQNAYSGSELFPSGAGAYSNWSIYNAGTSATFSSDSIIYKATPGQTTSSSVKLSATSASDGALNTTYAIPSADQNISGYDFIVLWIRSNFGAASTGTINVYITQGGSNVQIKSYDGLNASQWYRLVVPLRNPSFPSFTAATGIILESYGAASAVSNIWFDEVAFDYGLWTNLEFQIPDNVIQTIASPRTNGSLGQTNLMTLGCWNGTDYADWNNNQGDGTVTATSVAPTNGFIGNFINLAITTGTSTRTWYKNGGGPEAVPGHTYQISFRYRSNKSFDLRLRDTYLGTAPANTGNAAYYSLIFNFTSGMDEGSEMTPILFFGSSGITYLQFENFQVIDLGPTVSNSGSGAEAIYVSSYCAQDQVYKYLLTQDASGGYGWACYGYKSLDGTPLETVFTNSMFSAFGPNFIGSSVPQDANIGNAGSSPISLTSSVP